MSNLNRQMSSRHLSMIALGGSLGTGIFLTSGTALYIAGPGGAFVAYLIMGLLVYLLMSSLGEMAAYRPISGSFCQYTSDYVGPSFGFAMGYNYWFNWAITIAVELIAASIVMRFWFPHVPPVLWCALFFSAVFALNCFPVRNYGEVEFWLSLVKVIAIVAFIVIGAAIIEGLNVSHTHYGFHNWRVGDAPFHGGWHSLLAVFLLSGFSFQGTELVGIAAGEAKDPSKSMPKAIKQVFWRLLVFYIMTMVIISFIIPYTDIRLLNRMHDVALSPFTLILSQTGWHGLAEIMNGVILLALISACNADMYSATRILWHLGDSGSAPAAFGRINRHGVPIYALLVTGSFGLLSLLCYFMGSTQIFLWLVNVSSMAGFLAWFSIALSHYRFRRQYVAQGLSLDALPYRSKWYPWTPIVAMAACAFVILGQVYILLYQGQFSWGQLFATYIGIPCVLLLWIAKRIGKKTDPIISSS